MPVHPRFYLKKRRVRGGVNVFQSIWEAIKRVGASLIKKAPGIIKKVGAKALPKLIETGVDLTKGLVTSAIEGKPAAEALERAGQEALSTLGEAGTRALSKTGKTLKRGLNREGFLPGKTFGPEPAPPPAIEEAPAGAGRRTKRKKYSKAVSKEQMLMNALSRTKINGRGIYEL